MLWELEIILFALLIMTSVIALELRDLLASIVVLGVFSFFTAFLLAVMGAVDVSLTEAVLGAGVTGVLFVTGLRAMGRRSVD
jgi:multicomponent Na+:H+ antiporter subunit B